MRRIALVSVLIFSFVFCYSQETSKVINEALEYWKQKDYSQFEAVYPQLYQEYVKENHPDYQEALKALRENDLVGLFMNLNNLVDEDYFLDEMKTDKNFESVYQHKDWSVLLERIEGVKSNYNEELRQELKQIQNRDQSIRILYMSVKDVVLKDALHAYMKEVDKESAEKIQSILDKYGWLGSDKIGSEANETLFLGIQHIDDVVVQDKYLPMLSVAVKEGNAEPWHLAFLTDRILMNQGKKQIYGTQIILSDNPENSYVVPLENPDKVDKLRAEIGLEPMEEYLEEVDMVWDLESYKKDLPRIERLYQERHERVNK